MAAPDVLELTRELVAMDTINPPGNEQRCAAFLASFLEASGFEVELIEFEPGRSNLIARLDGNGELPLCLTGHLDTVPLGAESWQHDPFAGETWEGAVYGRGTTDMKGGVAAMALAATRAAGRKGSHPSLLLLFTGGEETGCDGAKALCATPQLIGKAGAVLVGEPTSNTPLIGHKGALWLRGVCHGVTAHGSTPELGVNAIYAAARAVNKLEEFGFNVKPDSVMGSPSLNVGRIEGGLNVNSVPDRAVLDIDIRTIPGQDNADLLAQLKSYLEDCDELSPTVDVRSILSDKEDPWVQEVIFVLEKDFGIKSDRETANYFTDASVLTPALGNPPTVILGPGEVKVAHKVDEYCEISKLEESVDIFEALISRWEGREQA